MGDLREESECDFLSEPVPPELVGQWKPGGSRFIYEFTDEGTHAHFLSHSAADYAIATDGTTLTWAGFDYLRKFNVSTSLPGVWARLWPDEGVIEEFTFREDGSYTAHWTEWNEDYFGTYQENHPAPGKLAMLELNAIVTIAGDQVTFDPPYTPSRTGPFVLNGDTLTIDFAQGQVVYRRV
ncbi:MAG: hypothetical protein ABW185_01870 [Sedimenticola sp.]